MAMKDLHHLREDDRPIGSGRRLACLFLLVWLVGGLVTGQCQRLDSSWKVSVNGQSVLVNSDGSFIIPNISAPDQFGPGGPGTAPDFVGDDLVRLTGVSTKDGTNRYVISEYFQVRQASTYVVTNLTFSDIPPRKPETLRAIPDQTTLTTAGQTTQVRVLAQYADGSSTDVTPKTRYTSYRISNPAIATIDETAW